MNEMKMHNFNAEPFALMCVCVCINLVGQNRYVGEYLASEVFSSYMLWIIYLDIYVHT